MITDNQTLHPISPGQKLPNDWYAGTIPGNLIVGENAVIDSSFCFKHYYSSLETGLKIGSNVTIWRASLAAEEQAYIEIGDYCYIANASIVCSERISIGNYVFIAGGVTLADSDFHPIDPLQRLSDTIALSPPGNRTSRPAVKVSPIVIDDNVWIGYNATILKGVHIGAGATVSPGAFVIEDVPAGVTVAGNPAKPISE
jgi:acetyltransferase-like isoleucine patch superfamily enzyme